MYKRQSQQPQWQTNQLDRPNLPSKFPMVVPRHGYRSLVLGHCFSIHGTSWTDIVFAWMKSKQTVAKITLQGKLEYFRYLSDIL